MGLPFLRLPLGWGGHIPKSQDTHWFPGFSHSSQEFRQPRHLFKVTIDLRPLPFSRFQTDPLLHLLQTNQNHLSFPTHNKQQPSSQLSSKHHQQIQYHVRLRNTKHRSNCPFTAGGWTLIPKQAAPKTNPTCACSNVKETAKKQVSLQNCQFLSNDS